ncbi:hypothetical protein SDC9_160079 [bioreactor metagenome]|uniref:Uncharacterized protein n=1 Tax=bioreactor metagenome TaxID=1076179 RepID=A0A645FHD6_9ZZZZ
MYIVKAFICAAKMQNLPFNILLSAFDQLFFDMCGHLTDIIHHIDRVFKYIGIDCLNNIRLFNTVADDMNFICRIYMAVFNQLYGNLLVRQTEAFECVTDFIKSLFFGDCLHVCISAPYSFMSIFY